MTLPTYRHFCASARVLDVYLHGDAITDNNKLCKQLREAVALSLRTQDVCTPDHQHRHRQKNAFAECASLSDMLLQALGVTSHGATHGLEFRHGAFYVCAERMEEWQQEVTAYQSPVPVLAAAWVAQFLKEQRPMETAIPALCDSLKYSSLPSIHDPRLNRLIHDETNHAGRLCDLHVHINGSTEFTQVWLHSLLNIETTFREIDKAHTNDATKTRTRFFFKQLRVDPATIKKRLYMAATLRKALCKHLTSYCPDHDPANICTTRMLCEWMRGNEPCKETSYRHPFVHSDVPERATNLQREGAMWLYGLYVLHNTRDYILALLMHMYLLLMHQHLRLLVQQPEQFGFDQFQYITLAGAREDAEKNDKFGFIERFHQFQGMYGQDMAYVEARFAPKLEPQRILDFLSNVWNNYLEATGQAKVYIQPCSACPRIAQMFAIHNGELQLAAKSLKNSSFNPFTLGLVVHFIKSADGTTGSRHHKLRKTLATQAEALIVAKDELTKSRPELARALVGKDAASNEMDAPPEVFAPVFRQMNRAGISHSTYHAGEDFEHILCGIRAVYEAVFFLDMGSGDRIGHATALGLSPDLCEGKTVHCRKGQWLDNLVWLTKLLDQLQPLRQFAGEGFIAHTTIVTLYREIYQTDCPDLPVLWKAWELRRFDPKTVLNPIEAVHPNTKAEQGALSVVKCEAGEKLYELACKEFEKYHNRKNIVRWNEITVLQEKQQPSAALLRAVQDCVIDELCHKNIAIEVLPTSNVRISHYHSTDEHHIMRWLCSDDTRPAPQIVLGTDDPGIFSTTLRNEYAFVLKKLQHQHPGDCEKPYEIIRHLIENGMSYRFA